MRLFENRTVLVKRLAVWVADKYGRRMAFFVPIVLAILAFIIGGLMMDYVLESGGKDMHWILDAVIGGLFIEITFVAWLVIWLVGL